MPVEVVLATHGLQPETGNDMAISSIRRKGAAALTLVVLISGCSDGGVDASCKDFDEKAYVFEKFKKMDTDGIINQYPEYKQITCHDQAVRSNYIFESEMNNRACFSAYRISRETLAVLEVHYNKKRCLASTPDRTIQNVSKDWFDAWVRQEGY